MPHTDPDNPQPDDNFMRALDKPQAQEFGTLRGKKVRLADASARLSREDLEQVEVDDPVLGKIRPWRFAGSDEDVRIAPDGMLEI